MQSISCIDIIRVDGHILEGVIVQDYEAELDPKWYRADLQPEWHIVRLG